MVGTRGVDGSLFRSVPLLARSKPAAPPRLSRRWLADTRAAHGPPPRRVKIRSSTPQSLSWQLRRRCRCGVFAAGGLLDLGVVAKPPLNPEPGLRPTAASAATAAAAAATRLGCTVAVCWPASPPRQGNGRRRARAGSAAGEGPRIADTPAWRGAVLHEPLRSSCMGVHGCMLAWAPSCMVSFERWINSFAVAAADRTFIFCIDALMVVSW
eukprot:62958-Chlamydomonas_euryale.AAC.3